MYMIRTGRMGIYAAAAYLLIILFPSPLEAQGRKLDSLIANYHQEKDHGKKVRLCLAIASQYTQFNATESMHYARLAYDHAVKSKDSMNIADARNSIGNSFYIAGDFDKAREEYEAARGIYEKLKPGRGLATAINNIGLTYINQAKFTKGLEYQVQSLKQYESLKDTSGMLRSYNAIAVVYKELGGMMRNNSDYEHALEYFRKCLQLNEAVRDSVGYVNVLNNIGSTFQQTGQLDSAEQYLQRSYSIAERLHNTYALSNSLGNLSEIYRKRGQTGKALDAAERCLRMKKESGDQMGAAGTLILLVQIHLASGDTDAAMEYLNEAYEVSAKIGAMNEQMRAAQLLSEEYAAKQNYARAWEYLSSYVSLKDSLSSIENRQIIQEFKGRFEIEDQKKQIELLEQKNQIGELKSERQNQLLTFIIIGLGLVVIIAIVLYNRFLVKKRANVSLQKAYDLIEEKNKSITDSIRYAKHLQEAILPSQEMIKRLLPDSFILYKPKDIVAGDFYWVEENERMIFFAAADCTGHGVPGALVSVVCSKALNSAVREFHLTDPGAILDKATEIVLDTFSRSGSEVNDGMDISLCCFDRANMELTWAGANNPLWLVRDHGLTEQLPDKQPVGKAEKRKPFTPHRITVRPGDMLYLFTDGYADQFGGEKGKKFKYRQLQELILKVCNLPLAEQQRKLDEAFGQWKGRLEQVDDVLILGIRL